jgi:hypothetical protein
MSTRPTAALARARLDYDPETGVLRWKPREGSAPFDISWNARYAGKVAGANNLTTGHIDVRLSGRSYGAHRLAWLITYGEWPAGLLDHRDLNGRYNAISNLRLATPTQNIANAGLRRTNTSGFKGVSFNKQRRLYEANISIAGKQMKLGFFADPAEAHRVYMRKAREVHGEFARAA